jgi:hypothetical protein
MAPTIVRRLTNIATTGHTGPQPWEGVRDKDEKPGLQSQQTFDRTQIFDEYDVGDIYNEEQILRLQVDWGINL